MAYESARLKGIYGFDDKDFGGDLYSYTPTSDSLTTIMGANYFGSESDRLNVGDTIIVNHAAGRHLLKVTAKSAGSVTVVQGDHGQAMVQALSGAGAVDIVSQTTEFTSTGAAQALTLADGSFVGQRKTVIHVVDGGSGVLTPANALGFTTVTFTTAGEAVELEWHTGGWVVVGIGGVSATLPVVA